MPVVPVQHVLHDRLGRCDSQRRSGGRASTRPPTASVARARASDRRDDDPRQVATRADERDVVAHVSAWPNSGEGGPEDVCGDKGEMGGEGAAPERAPEQQRAPSSSRSLRSTATLKVRRRRASWPPLESPDTPLLSHPLWRRPAPTPWTRHRPRKCSTVGGRGERAVPLARRASATTTAFQLLVVTSASPHPGPPSPPLPPLPRHAPRRRAS